MCPSWVCLYEAPGEELEQAKLRLLSVRSGKSGVFSSLRPLFSRKTRRRRRSRSIDASGLLLFLSGCGGVVCFVLLCLSLSRPQ